VLVPLDDPDDPDDLGGFPEVAPLASVVAGWGAMTGTSPVRADLPDSGLLDGIAATRARLLLAAGTAADRPLDLAAVARLDDEGFAGQARELLVARLEAPTAWKRLDPVEASELLAVAARHWALTRDRAFAEDVLPVLVLLARRVAKAAGPAGDEARHRFADLLEGIGQPDAARKVRPGGPRPAPAAEDRWARVAALRQAASPTWTWADDADRDRFLAAVRDALVAEAPGVVDLLPGGLGPFAGQPVELHGAPTAFGTLSFAVRWHGPRPALLWELAAPADGETRDVTVRASGLDPAFSSTDRQGEQLLAGAREDGPAPADPGASFS
jgi:hypothetical protein